VLSTFSLKGYNFSVKSSLDSIWVIAHWPSGGGCGFRLAHCAGARLRIKELKRNGDKIDIALDSALGAIKIKLETIENNTPLLHWSTSLKSPLPLTFPCMPRDVYPLDENNDAFSCQGKVYSKQEGPKAGILYLTIDRPTTGSILYMQNFTVLNPYFERTRTQPTGVVAGKWPELGFSLPNSPDTDLPANLETIISDAFVLLTETVPKDEFEAAEQYLDMQIPLYFQLHKPQTSFHDYLSKAQQVIHDLENKKCVIEIGNQRYLRPYVNAEDKPPESMVQLAVLMPLVEYESWYEEPIEVCNSLRSVIQRFYDPKLHTITRYLPGVPFKNDNREQQEDHNIMDSWYLFHPMLNLARLAKKGYNDAKKLFFDSLDYAIKGAHHFNYQWPVFYKMDTFDTKESNDPQGETDVACIYALTMVHAYELSNDERFLEEAKKAAESIRGLGFNLPYQINVTAFGASAFYRLYKITGDKKYQKQVSVCIANIFGNSWLWECEYGYAKNYRTFVGIPPLAKMHDNDYLASYEELEVLSAFDDLLDISQDQELRPSIQLLLAEFTRYVLDRCWSYFPSELPKDMITDNPKTGKINPKLAFPLEDLREGWQKAGQVGQEVYGAGGVLITITRHFNHQKGWPFIVFSEYPTRNYQLKDSSLSFHVCGDSRLSSSLRILPYKNYTTPKTRVFQQKQNENITVDGKPTKEGQLNYTIPGGSDVLITWSKEDEKPNSQAT
jgi:hypothetical protein